jgi:hypothetical protein
MMHNQVVRIIFMLLTISTSSGAFITGKRQERHKVAITGRVLAYDQLSSLSNITSAPKLEVLIVGVETGPEESRFIKVKYEYMASDKKLPIKVFDSKNKWRFALVRDNTCDGSLRSLQETKPMAATEISLPHFKSTNGAESEQIPLDLNIPCYVLLHHRDLKPTK